MRLNEFDGLRGFALIIVVGFHYLCRWTELYPYGTEYSGIAFFKHGIIGLHLFFMLSGYVILMTMDRTETFRSFIIKRWIRVIPSMIIATIFILTTYKLFPYRPIGEPRLIDALPGLLLNEPYYLAKVLHLKLNNLEGAFWSLYVEFRFYLIFGLAYYFLGKKRAIYSLILLLIFALFVSLAANLNIPVPFSKQLIFIFSDLLLGRYLFWFVVGIIAYEYEKGNFSSYKNILIISLIVGFLYLLAFDSSPVLISESLGVILFYLVVKHKAIKVVFSNKFLVFLGFISYPIYLIHENAGVSLIISLGKLNFFPLVTLPIISISILILFAYPYALYVEPSLQKKLKKLLNV